MGLRPADGSGMGICLPGRNRNCLLSWQRSVQHEANFRGASPYGPEAKAGPSAVRTKPVGSYAPNPGVFTICTAACGMDGRLVREVFPRAIVRSEGSASGLSRVKRGGSWFLPAAYLRCASRSGSPPVERSHDLGFRLAFKQVE